MIKYSIIIPTYNRCDLLNRCLRNISKLTKPEKHYEVIVIDNGSVDNTKETVLSYQNKIPNLRYLFDEKPGLHIGRHLGCREAKGDILCYLDDDSFVSENWLIGIENSFRNSSVVIATGPCLAEYENTPPKWLKYGWKKNKYGKYYGILSLIDFGNKKKFISPLYVFGCNFIIRKSILIEFGGFNPDGMPESLIKYRGDGETSLAVKLHQNNKKAFYSPDIKINHFVVKSRMTEAYFAKRAFNQGVSDSFTEIRDLNKVSSVVIPNTSYFIRFFKSILSIIKLHNKNYRKYKKIMKSFKDNYLKGKIFHQNEFNNDLELKEYVLKETYMEI